MSLTKLIQDMKEKGLISIAPIKLVGKAKPTFDILAIMNDTEPYKVDASKFWLERN